MEQEQKNEELSWIRIKADNLQIQVKLSCK